MNNLSRLYTSIKGFADSHNMVNEFILVGSEEEVSKLTLQYRTLVLIPLEANISRELNNPTYSLDFGVIVIDRTIQGDEEAYVSSTEENLFIMGQLQDYLLQESENVDFQAVELASSSDTDYNVTVAMANFTVELARKPYIRDIDND